MQIDWTIQGRAEKCAATGHEFQDGENFYTLLFHDREGFRRQDLSEEAWRQRNDNIQPFSFWRSKFESPSPPAPEPLARENAENLLRTYMQDNSSAHANARYILAVMLERKRLLKPIETKEDAEGRTLIYEHAKTGEIFIIPDPRLRIDQIESVQNEVAALLK